MSPWGLQHESFANRMQQRIVAELRDKGSMESTALPCGKSQHAFGVQVHPAHASHHMHRACKAHAAAGLQ